MQTFTLPGSPEKLQGNLSACKLAYSSAEFMARIKVVGTDPNSGKIFSVEIQLTEADPEFQEMVNNYAARIISQIKIS